MSEEIRRILEDREVESKIQRLVKRAASLESHFVVVSAEGLSSSSRFALTPIRPEFQVPKSHIGLPQGLRRIWVIQPGGLGVSFDARDGYNVYDLRDVCSPD